jgi:hypothetical protein
MAKTGGGEPESVGAAVGGPAEGGGQHLHACPLCTPFQRARCARHFSVLAAPSA